MIINAPLLLVIRNRWDIAVSFKDASGNPVDLTQLTPFAEFYPGGGAPAVDLRVGSGITLTTAGNAIVSLLGATTGALPPRNQIATTFPVRVEIGLLDGTGEKTTFVLQPITPLDPATVGVADIGPLMAPPQVSVTIPTLSPTQVAVGIPGVAGPPGPAGSGASTSNAIVCAEPIGAGAPVYVDRTSRQARAARADTYLACFVAGIAVAAAAASFAADVRDGPVALADWTASTGGPDLVPGATYFVGVTGGLTVLPPMTTPGATVAAVGRALDARTLLVAPFNPIKL